MIHVDVLPETWRAFERYAEARFPDYEWLRQWMEPQNFAWFIALLQAEPDTPELFPHGKWATIQHLQNLLARAAREEVEKYTVKNVKS